MPVTVIVGGQFGSEGKGKVAHAWAQLNNASVAVRVGGSNSGHTAIDHGGKARSFRQLPTTALFSDVTSVIAAGSYVDPDVLAREIEETGATPDNLIIDPAAVIITEAHRQAECDLDLIKRIGSTGSGTGAAVVNRIQRDPSLQFVGTDTRFKPFVQETIDILRERLDRGQRVLIEGTQGFGLSLLHSGYYPKTTSRDTTAAAFVSEVGLSPMDVDEIVMVLRTFPIRVAGDSGPLPNEIDWETVTKESRSPEPITEQTTVTGKQRRVARFDPEVVKQAIAANRPTAIVLNHLDYIDFASRESGNLADTGLRFLQYVEREIGSQIDFCGFGPRLMIDRQSVTRLKSVAIPERRWA